MLRLLRYDWPLHFILLITNWLPDNVFFIRLRGRLARPFFRKCGRKLGIGRNVTFYNPSKMEIGNWVYIAYGCWFQGADGLVIEDEVLFGPYVVISPSSHTREQNSWRFGKPTYGKVQIKKGSWLGAHTSLVTSLTIGEGAVVASNTPVTTSVPPHTLFAGYKGSVVKEYQQN